MDMNDGPGERTSPPCPECGSGRTVEIEEQLTNHDYRCLDCGTEFDENGGARAVLP